MALDTVGQVRESTKAGADPGGFSMDSVARALHISSGRARCGRRRLPERRTAYSSSVGGSLRCGGCDLATPNPHLRVGAGLLDDPLKARRPAAVSYTHLTL